MVEPGLHRQPSQWTLMQAGFTGDESKRTLPGASLLPWSHSHHPQGSPGLRQMMHKVCNMKANKTSEKNKLLFEGKVRFCLVGFEG